MDPSTAPLAPAFVSTDDGEDPASPAAGPIHMSVLTFHGNSYGKLLPSPGCCGGDVATALNTEEMEAADISGVVNTVLVVSQSFWCDQIQHCSNIEEQLQQQTGQQHLLHRIAHVGTVVYFISTQKGRGEMTSSTAGAGPGGI